MATSTPTRLRIPSAVYDALIAQAIAEAPNECCGLLAGAVTADGTGIVTHHYPLVNEEASPWRFRSEPRSMFNAIKAMRAAGADVLAVYHSHPKSVPVPSRTDLEQNYSEEVVNLIVGLGGPAPEVRAWWLSAEGQREAEWEAI